MKNSIISRYGGSLLVMVTFILMGLGWLPGNWLDRLDQFIYDTKLVYSMPNTVDQRLVIIDIDEKSLAKLGRWPWPRDLMGELVDTLFDHYKVNSLGFDVVFAEPDTGSGLTILENLAEGSLRDLPLFQQTLNNLRPSLQRDHLFAKALTQRPTVMGYYFKHQLTGEGKNSGALPPPIIRLPPEQAHDFPAPLARGFGGNLELLQEMAAAGGFFNNVLVDSDGIYRRVPLFQRYKDGVYPSLALTLAMMALENPELSFSEDSNELLLDGGTFRIPFDDYMAVMVPYRGYQGSFPYISIVDILQKKVPLEALEGRIILMGTTAPGILDLRATPVQNIFAGVEIHANIVSGILDSRFQSRPDTMLLFELILSLFLGILLTLLLPRLSPLANNVVTTVVVISLVGVHSLIWHNGIVMNLGMTFTMVAAIYLFHMAYGFFIESAGKRQISKVFGQYIPPELVDEMNQSGNEFSIGGESREMTVLFSDVRSFTTISEGLKPDELVSMMNAFLTPMTETIHTNRGTIDKYMGDAIMAFWGAPLDDENHARHGVRAGFELMGTMDKVSQEFAKRGWPELKIGVGLNSGVMNVGNMGSAFRMAYTALGDAVNLGSRLEGLTKQYGVDIIIGEGTYAQIDDLWVRELDRVRVKGKLEPISIYEPVCFEADGSDTLHESIERYQTALQLYRKQQWQEAQNAFTALQQAEPERMIHDIYLQRIAYFSTHPPGDSWDGVFTHTSK
uniref:Guanylate cyclase domain-containing protein n=1 Tax=Magnetococcus massalia (strain MO-1) TaxID=451514 RepID=A0A1S7LEZ5_MAGMO|nr:Conserved membrane protein of unknown function. Containing adenylate/guanylate cyclase domain [similar to the protein Mmc1_1858 from MC-1] [Candidatus Magnetococcus massalia]